MSGFRVSLMRVVVDYFEVELESRPPEATRRAIEKVKEDPSRYQLARQHVMWSATDMRQIG